MNTGVSESVLGRERETERERERDRETERQRYRVRDRERGERESFRLNDTLFAIACITSVHTL